MEGRSGNYEYHGQSWMWCESYGTLHTDIYGLSTATAIWVSPQDSMQYPSMYSPHPIWGFMHIEKRTVSIEYGFCRTTCEYAGFEGDPVPIIEWSSGMSEEPIQTHPNFASFAGTPSAPINNSKWVDAEGAPTKSDTLGIFDKFAYDPTSGPENNSLAGVSSYLSPCLVKRITHLSSTELVVTVGHLDGGMLKVAASSTQRGIAFMNIEEWRGAGRRGWNSNIYS